MAGPVTLKNAFEKEGDLKYVVGTEYLAELASSIITIINAEDYGHTIVDPYMRRELIALGQDLLRHAYEPQLEQEHVAMAIIEQTEGHLFRLTKAENMGGGVQTLSEVMRKVAESTRLPFNHDGSVTDVTVGFMNLESRPAGPRPSHLMLLVDRAWARPCTLAASTLAASPTPIGGKAVRLHAQTQGRGLLHASPRIITEAAMGRARGGGGRSDV